MTRTWFAALLAIVANPEVRVAEFDVKTAKVELLWESAIPANSPSAHGRVLASAATLADGKIAFLAQDWDSGSVRTVLLMDAESGGLEHGVPLTVGPVVLSFAAAGTDTVWLGGQTNRYLGIASDAHAESYLAQVDHAARIKWERAYKLGAYSAIVSIAPIAGGNVAVLITGGYSSPGRLRMLDGSNGDVIWERPMSHGLSGGVLAEAGHLIAVTFESSGGNLSYTENVVARAVSLDGHASDPTIIRHAINTDNSARYGSLRMSAQQDGAFVVSNWEESFLRTGWKPAEIANLDAEGKVRWTKTLQDSFEPVGSGGVRYCSEPAVATLPDGDALVACALYDQIHLHRFSRKTGEDEQGVLPLPSCNTDRPAVLFLFTRDDGSVVIAGSRPQSNVGTGCSWIGRLSGASGQRTRRSD